MRSKADFAGIETRPIGQGWLVAREEIRMNGRLRYSIFFMHSTDGSMDCDIGVFARKLKLPRNTLRDRALRVLAGSRPPSLIWEKYSSRKKGDAKPRLKEVRPVKLRVSEDYFLERMPDRRSKKGYIMMLVHRTDRSLDMNLTQLAKRLDMSSGTIWDRAERIANGIIPPRTLMEGTECDLDCWDGVDWALAREFRQATKPVVTGAPLSILAGSIGDF